MPKPWLRLYRDAIYKPKVGRLVLDEIGFWAACLMMSDDDGRLPKIEDVAWALRLPVGQAEAYMLSLERNALVTRYVTDSVTTWQLHDFAEHQRKSDYGDTGAERQRKFREAKKARKSADSKPVTKRNALRNAPVTLPDTDTDTDKKKERLEATPARPKAQRWPPNAVVSNDWIMDGLTARARNDLPPINLKPEAEAFANYWASKSGQGGTKLDWHRTWLNWCLNAKGKSHGTAKQTQLEQLASIARADTVFDE